MHLVRLAFSTLSWIRALSVALSLLVLTPSAYCQVVSFVGMDDAGYGWSRTWIDINDDGRDDYCLIAGSNGERLECYLSNGSTFGPTKQVFGVPAVKAPLSMHWVDINGDGKPDLCRPFGLPNANLVGNYGITPSNSGGLNCRLGPAFSTAVTISVPMKWFASTQVSGNTYFVGSYSGLRTWENLFTADVNGDGLTDVCYVHEDETKKTLRCLIGNGAGVQAQSTAWISTEINDGLPDWPRGFNDFNGDGYPDFCRVISGGSVHCLLGGPNGFSTNVALPAISMPFKEGASFVDINGDGLVDFCRIVGSSGNYSLSCRVSNGIGWESRERTSPVIADADIGDGQNRWWVDINADGLPDFCRAVSSSRLSCRLSRGDGDLSEFHAFGFSDVYIDGVDFGVTDGGRNFCDANGSGVKTYCRATYTVTGSTQVCHYGDIDQECFTLPGSSRGILAGLVAPSSMADVALQARPPLLTAFSDGVGAEVRISYLPLTNPEVYTRSGGGSYPRALISQPRSSVVYETRSWQAGTSTPMTGIARYAFKDLRNDSWLGSRGFRERWIFTEASNVLEHVVFYQGLGSSVDSDSLLNDRREIGQVKMREKYAVAANYLPTPVTSPTAPSLRTAYMHSIMSFARSATTVQPTPSAQSPFVLLQKSTNKLTDTVPANARYRFVGETSVQSWDWNNESGAAVPLPTVTTTTSMSDVGNVLSVAETTNSNGLVWSKTTDNQYDPAKQNPSAWILGRLTKSTVTSVAPTVANQLAAYSTSPGRSPNAAAMSSATPAVAQPINPSLLSIIMQLLLAD